MKKLVIQIGFITNSSSVIHWYSKEILEDPDVQAFLKAYEIQDGFVGKNMWYRSACGSFLVTGEQIADAKANLDNPDYGVEVGDHLEPESVNGGVVVIYGDEHNDLASELNELLREVADKKSIPQWNVGFN